MWSAISRYASLSFLVAGPSSAAADSCTALYCVLIFSYIISCTTAALATSNGAINAQHALGTDAISVT